MSSLYEATRPGRKLYPRLMELGGFIGIKEGGIKEGGIKQGAIKQDDQLVAMACLRLHLPGYREISTVGTLPGHTGRGYATALVGELARRSRNAGKQAFLTVSTSNRARLCNLSKTGFSPPCKSHFHYLSLGRKLDRSSKLQSLARNEDMTCQEIDHEIIPDHDRDCDDLNCGDLHGSWLPLTRPPKNSTRTVTLLRPPRRQRN